MPREKTPSYPSHEEMVEREQEQAIEEKASWGPSKELEPLAESPVLNKMLLRHARKSYTDIEKITGIPAAEVAERLTILLDNTSLRDDLMEEKLLLAEVGLLIDDIRMRMNRVNVEDEGWASMARVQLAAIKTLLEQVDKRRKAVDGQLALVTLAQAQLMGEAIRIAQERAVLTIQQQHPEWDTDVVYDAFESALPGAIQYVESQVDDGAA